MLCVFFVVKILILCGKLVCWMLIFCLVVWWLCCCCWVCCNFVLFGWSWLCLFEWGLVLVGLVVCLFFVLGGFLKGFVWMLDWWVV